MNNFISTSLAASKTTCDREMPIVFIINFKFKQNCVESENHKFTFQLSFENSLRVFNLSLDDQLAAAARLITALIQLLFDLRRSCEVFLICVLLIFFDDFVKSDFLKFAA